MEATKIESKINIDKSLSKENNRFVKLKLKKIRSVH
jgi:hypothetical protein